MMTPLTCCYLAQSVLFTVAVLPAEEGALKTHSGVANGLVLDHANGVGGALVNEVTPGATLTNVALFIDSSTAALTPLAQEKYWWCAPLPPSAAPSCPNASSASLVTGCMSASRCTATLLFCRHDKSTAAATAS